MGHVHAQSGCEEVCGSVAYAVSFQVQFLSRVALFVLQIHIGHIAEGKQIVRLQIKSLLVAVQRLVVALQEVEGNAHAVPVFMIVVNLAGDHLIATQGLFVSFQQQ